MKEAKVEKFISLKQGSMSVRDYSLKFVKHYKSGDYTLQEVSQTTWRRVHHGN